VKILVSINDRLLERIDAAARARGLSRSTYLARLAERDLEVSRGPGRRPAVRQALSRLDVLFRAGTREVDSTAAVREERDAR
jgi:metal-responsive CopG/Arc/MetJ family transcriptional regulator